MASTRHDSWVPAPWQCLPGSVQTHSLWKVRSVSQVTRGFPTDIPVLTCGLPRLMLCLRVANSGGLSLLNSYHLDDIEEGIPRIIYIIISLPTIPPLPCIFCSIPLFSLLYKQYIKVCRATACRRTVYELILVFKFSGVCRGREGWLGPEYRRSPCTWSRRRHDRRLRSTYHEFMGWLVYVIAPHFGNWLAIATGDLLCKDIPSTALLHHSFVPITYLTTCFANETTQVVCCQPLDVILAPQLYVCSQLDDS
jgi:hypothetical protein